VYFKWLRAGWPHGFRRQKFISIVVLGMSVALGALTAILGATVGSFLNVAILRTHAERPVTGRSACPYCHKALRWWELVPIMSYLWLRGRCQRCHHRLDIQYPFVELLTAILFVQVLQDTNTLFVSLGVVIVVAAMIAIGVYDLRWSAIPDSFTIALGVGALILMVTRSMPWTEAVIGAVAGGAFFSAQYFLSGKRWVGSGDIFLGIALGVLLGWRMLGLALFLAYMFGTIMALALLLRKRLKLSSAIPFGPFLVTGSFLAWQWGEEIVTWYFDHALFL
jgi:prepilin signal peptidase PulO-like enzyme (type II secretory pathway)